MALIIEDGTIVANANSYSTLDEIKAYASMRNYVLVDDDAVVEGYAIRATDYLETFRDEYIGELVDPTQPLAFPRKDMEINGAAWPSDKIPPQIIRAQQQLVVEQNAGIVLLPTYTGEGRVKRKRIDRLETEWFDGGATGSAGQPYMPLIDAMLVPLLKPGQFGLRTLRI